MHPAVELLLARIDSNPEEFVEGMSGRWGSILIRLSEAAPEEDWDRIQVRLRDIRLDEIHRQIMRELCAPESPPKQMSLLTAAEMKAHALELLNRG